MKKNIGKTIKVYGILSLVLHLIAVLVLFVELKQMDVVLKITLCCAVAFYGFLISALIRGFGDIVSIAHCFWMKVNGLQVNVNDPFVIMEEDSAAKEKEFQIEETEDIEETEETENNETE